MGIGLIIGTIVGAIFWYQETWTPIILAVGALLIGLSLKGED